jgi:hypothetical protein
MATRLGQVTLPGKLKQMADDEDYPHVTWTTIHTDDGLIDAVNVDLDELADGYGIKPGTVRQYLTKNKFRCQGSHSNGVSIWYREDFLHDDQEIDNSGYVPSKKAKIARTSSSARETGAPVKSARGAALGPAPSVDFGKTPMLSGKAFLAMQVAAHLEKTGGKGEDDEEEDLGPLRETVFRRIDRYNESTSTYCNLVVKMVKSSVTSSDDPLEDFSELLGKRRRQLDRMEEAVDSFRLAINKQKKAARDFIAKMAGAKSKGAYDFSDSDDDKEAELSGEEEEEVSSGKVMEELVKKVDVNDTEEAEFDDGTPSNKEREEASDEPGLLPGFMGPEAEKKLHEEVEASKVAQDDTRSKASSGTSAD